MKKLILILLITLSFLIIPQISSHAEGEEITDDTNQIITETEEEPFLTANQIILLVVSLIMYILAIFMSVLTNNRLLIAFSGLLWVIPIIIIDNFIIRVFSAIVILVSFMILIKSDRGEYYE